MPIHRHRRSLLLRSPGLRPRTKDPHHRRTQPRDIQFVGQRIRTSRTSSTCSCTGTFLRLHMHLQMTVSSPSRALQWEFEGILVRCVKCCPLHVYARVLVHTLTRSLRDVVVTIVRPGINRMKPPQTQRN